ncbi:hypothetical protein Tco_0286612 [Tanacetum coccineum]
MVAGWRWWLQWCRWGGDGVEYGGVGCHGDEGGDGVVIWWFGDGVVVAATAVMMEVDRWRSGDDVVG